MLGARITYLRKTRGLTQKEMAEFLGITRPAYTAYEKESRQPDYRTLNKLADFFDVTTDYLLGRSNSTGREEIKEYLVDVSDELVDLISNPNNQVLLQTLKKMVDQGYSNEAIIEWIEMLGPMLNNIEKKYGNIYAGSGRVFHQNATGMVSEKVDKSYGRKRRKPKKE